MKKIGISIITMLLIIAIMVVPSFAADLSVTYTLDNEKPTAKLGATVQVTLGVSDIDASTDGINAIEGKISYDEALIESVDVVSAGNNWSVSYNNRDNDEKKGKVVISNMNAVKETQAIAKIMITLKSDATVESGTVTLENLTTSYGSTATEPVTKTITVSVDKGSDVPDTPDTPDTPPVPDTPPTPDTPPASDTPSSGSTTPTTKPTGTTGKTTSTATALPKAGIAPGIILAIVAGIIVATIELVKYKKIGK